MLILHLYYTPVHNPFICAFTRIYFYLSNIKKFKLYETNVLDIEKRPFNNDIKNCVFLCDLPLVGNKTIPIFDDGIFTKKILQQFILIGHLFVQF